MSGNEKPYVLFLIYSVLSRLTFCEKRDDGCGHSVLGPESGVLSSRNYPGTYPNNSWCEWKIVLAQGSGVILRFSDLNIEESECETSYVRIIEGSPAGSHAHRTFCSQLSSSLPEVHVKSSEVTVQFQSGQHISGRGFLLSYATTEHKDLVTCLDKGSQFSASKYRKYCPAGCMAVQGDVSGDVSQGYRHTSVLCKAAVHAGVIVDELGGQISVYHKKGLSHYPGTKANGVQSKAGSLSETLFTFENSACRNWVSLPMSMNASSWFHITQMYNLAYGPPNVTHLASTNYLWIAGDDGNNNGSSGHWLHLDLGEEKKVTDIVTTGSTLVAFDYYVQAFRIEYRERNSWKMYTKNNSSDNMVFEGNTDNFHMSRNTFHPPIVTRYLRVMPVRWHQRIAMVVELLGCPHVEVTPPRPGTTQPDGKESGEEMADLVKLLFIVVPSVLLVLILPLVVCGCKTLHRKKTKNSIFGASDYKEKTGCWKHLKQPFTRHTSTEFTISYNSEKEPMQKLNLVTSAMAVEYQQPSMIGVGTVSRKGSTFRPMDTDAKEEPGDAAAHYDYLQTANQYALPLTSLEPEYATPIIERHAFRKEGFLPDPSYSVPGTVLSKTPSFNTADVVGCRVPVAFSGSYKAPQVKAEKLHSSEEVYDRPKVKPSSLPNGTGSDYQSPQVQASVVESYSMPRDCVKRANSVPHKHEQLETLCGT